MLGNYININDLSTLLKKGPIAFSILISRLKLNRQDRVRANWAHTHTPPQNWWDIPSVQKRWNRLISGDPQVDYYEYISQKYFTNRESLHALSLGCGNGDRELAWAETAKFRSIDAYDLSEPRIKKARSNAMQKGYDNIINYRVDNVYNVEMREDYYDVIFGEGSLHHFSPIEDILLRSNKFLNPDGYFIVNEFVGPTRFQWTDRQLKVINNLLSILPDKYKTIWNSDVMKSQVFKPGRLRMFLSDPSEAVESSKIEPLLHQIFDVVEVKAYGGTILHQLFSGIAHNFLSNDTEPQRWLDICFEVEDLLLASGDIQSDFIVAICKKRLH